MPPLLFQTLPSIICITRFFFGGGGNQAPVALACCKDPNPDTQRQALAAIGGLCTMAENRIKALQKGILDPLILMKRSNTINIIREVSSTLNSLSSEQENKEKITWPHDECCAIANLVERMDVHPWLLEE
jgi:hypothetical protein